MKFLLTVFMSLFAVSAFACPDLTGTYQCKKDDNDAKDTGVISFAMASSGGYIVTDKDDPSNPGSLPTDGQTYQDGDNSYTGSCSGNIFQAVITGVDQQVGPYTVNAKFYLDPASNLVEDEMIKFNYGGQPHQQQYKETCTKIL
jgi:hypothetical protein